MPLSKTQIDKLGERLRKGSCIENDLQLLEEYRLSFNEAYLAVIDKIEKQGDFRPTGRIKVTRSISEKLRRQKIKLSRIQDIAGCRIVLPGVVLQEQFAASLKNELPGLEIIDKRKKPSSGYRAVHLIAQIDGKDVEIQVRTSLQHLWAEVHFSATGGAC